jgi:RING finger protein 121
VYKFFLIVYKVCFATAVGGYFVIMADIFGLSLLFGDSFGSTGVLFLFYGLYFGVMGRDFAHEATERMANNIGAIFFLPI